MNDYSVTWNQVKAIVDILLENHDERVPMRDIESAVEQAWVILFDGMHTEVIP